MAEVGSGKGHTHLHAEGRRLKTAAHATAHLTAGVRFGQVHHLLDALQPHLTGTIIDGTTLEVIFRRSALRNCVISVRGGRLASGRIHRGGVKPTARRERERRGTLLGLFFSKQHDVARARSSDAAIGISKQSADSRGSHCRWFCPCDCFCAELLLTELLFEQSYAVAYLAAQFLARLPGGLLVSEGIGVRVEELPRLSGPRLEGKVGSLRLERVPSEAHIHPCPETIE